jgi:hypothetical protein
MRVEKYVFATSEKEKPITEINKRLKTVRDQLRLAVQVTCLTVVHNIS